MRDYTALPHEYLEEMESLSSAAFGRLVRALMAYSINGTEPELNGPERAYWKRVKNREDRYQVCFANQAEVRQKRARTAAAARWSKQDAQTEEPMLTHAQACSSITSNAWDANTNTNTDSNSNTNTNTNSDTDSDSDTDSNAQTQTSAEPWGGSAEEVLVRLKYKDKEYYPVPKSYCDTWQAKYRTLNVAQELRRIQVWLEKHPERLRSETEVFNFVRSWLDRAQARPAATASGERQCDADELAAIARMMERG